MFSLSCFDIWLQEYSTLESAHVAVEKQISVMLNWPIPFLQALHWLQWFFLCHYCRPQRWVLEYFESSVSIRDGFCPVHPRPTPWSWYFYTPLFLRWTLAREMNTEWFCGRRIFFFFFLWQGSCSDVSLTWQQQLYLFESVCAYVYVCLHVYMC